MTERLAKDLNCEGKLEAVLKKLVLHKTGSLHDKYANVEKDKDTFGTLIIKLPSVYSGGETKTFFLLNLFSKFLLKLKNLGEFVVYDDCKISKRIYDFDNKSQDTIFNIQYVAHLANLEYELLKVTAGYRLLLVYSLMRKEPTNMTPLIKKPSGTSNVFNSEIIDKMYSHLLRTTYLQKSLSILLENEYTVTEIRTSGSDALKGITKINIIL